MPRINTNKAHELIAELKPFTSNGSLSANWQNGDYVVMSYGTAIALVNPSENLAVLNGRRYSVTTSKHQGQARRGVSDLAGYDIRTAADPDEFEELTGYTIHEPRYY